MTEIKNEIYYHIGKGNNLYSHLWNVGEAFAFNNDRKNYYYQSLFDYLNEIQNECAGKLPFATKAFEDKSVIEEFNKNVKDIIEDDIYRYRNVSCFLTNLSTTAKNFSDKYLQVLREIVLEKERLANFSKYPSRQSCLWVCTKENLAKWDELFNNSSHAVYKLELTGSIFCTDGDLLDGSLYERAIDFNDLAKEYWSGGKTQSTREEYLFEGTAKILNKYASIKEV